MEITNSFCVRGLREVMPVADFVHDFVVAVRNESRPIQPRLDALTRFARTPITHGYLRSTLEAALQLVENACTGIHPSMNRYEIAIRKHSEYDRREDITIQMHNAGPRARVQDQSVSTVSFQEATRVGRGRTTSRIPLCSVPMLSYQVSGPCRQHSLANMD